MDDETKKAERYSDGRGLRTRGFDDLFGDMQRFQRSLGEWARPFFADFAPMSLLDPWVSDTQVPRLDIQETEKEYNVVVELPGIRKEDIEVEVSDENVVEISGKKTEDKSENKSNYLKRERSERSFHRSFSLPDEIDQDRIEAQVENGILSLKLPKKVETPRKTKKVEVK
ncbi:MAG: Hsp20/alpha crystallin family protein [Thermoplasmata archaeon]|nr:Hsp20/alpha crystallin family protein [Candidatus Sysuiplasma acidicola]MBX8636914.1 Hsp20/alpha crystallin family protein [Candidatus Sysuiplasma acidicola]MBX8645242.1 Hsp20/alpha crystallin family protein [Candidatus Sysuiplasma acidicola]